ncbi:hypothetical protein GXM_09005 [Nostoc sphaeroides CCNUC1]|uniref:Uncharacterized protein n=1 Tax=Nostoc sphaeroides CCNUC1 TaxID=2653204 RepID=A0A5P8WG14_9NOSO|nr:hypothetical protein GXM_09005 [Nostoc sphaeroides CCNUC1]
MALRKGKIVEAAGVQRSGGAGEKEEILGIAFRYLEIPLCPPAPLPPCSSAIPTPLTFQLNLVPFSPDPCFV